jgi:hypothetical protein
MRLGDFADPEDFWAAVDFREYPAPPGWPARAYEELTSALAEYLVAAIRREAEEAPDPVAPKGGALPDPAEAGPRPRRRGRRAGEGRP